MSVHLLTASVLSGCQRDRHQTATAEREAALWISISSFCTILLVTLSVPLIRRPNSSVPTHVAWDALATRRSGVEART